LKETNLFEEKKMKFFIIAAFLIGLTCQLDADVSYEYGSIFPLKAVAVLHGETKDPIKNQSYSIIGSVSFYQYELLDNITVTVDIFGLPPHNVEAGLLRGLHIHTYGIVNVTSDVKSTCGSTGPHYNPLNVTHGSMNSTVRHLGDLGNVVTFKNGTIRSVYNVSGFDLYGPYSVIGRSVVLHESEDDYGTKDSDMSRSVGTSGARIACGVIGWDKSESGSVENGFFSYIWLSTNITTSIEITSNETNMGFWYIAFEDNQSKDESILKYIPFEDKQEKDHHLSFVGFEDQDSLLENHKKNFLNFIDVSNGIKSNTNSIVPTVPKVQQDSSLLRKKLFKL